MPSVRLEPEASSSFQPAPLTVVWFCNGSTEPAAPSSANHDALSFLRALKGEPLVGEATVPLPGGPRRLGNHNLDEAIDWFGAMVAGYLKSRSLAPSFFAVPIPDADTTLESSAGPWTSLLAMAVASELEEQTETLDVLRWKKSLKTLPTEVASAGRLWENLALLGKVDWDRPVLLVDHLVHAARAQACHAFLRAQGAQVLLCAMAGRIAPRTPSSPFGVFKAELSGLNTPPR